MHKLISELSRLYALPGALSEQVLAQRMGGPAAQFDQSGQSDQPGQALSLTSPDGMTRAMVMAFDKQPGGGDAQHWTRLCTVANALQAELALPAPAVSISGDHGFCLWLALRTPAPTALVDEFLGLLRKAYDPDTLLRPHGAAAAVELPPVLHTGTGRWAAFINPGLGASFADEAGLEMAPPLAGQAALLEGVDSISAAQFEQALLVLRTQHAAAPSAAAPALHASAQAARPEGLLLRDATLEDIVRFLHAQHIEPTFRHLLRE